jgi:membrane protein
MADAPSRWWDRALALLSGTAQAAQEDDVGRMAASMSFWLLVTIAPLAFVATRFAGPLVLQSAPFADFLGVDLAQFDAEATEIYGTSLEAAGPLAPIVALGFVLLGAAAVFGQFVGAIGQIWNQPAERGPLYQFARHNLLAFAMLAAAGAATIASAVVLGLVAQLQGVLAQLVELTGVDLPEVSASVLSSWLAGPLTAFVLFAVAFALVPSNRPRLFDVLPGAAITAAAYAVGQFMLTDWLSRTTRFEIYGAYGAFIGTLVWVYYSALIALVGAELTHQWVVLAEARRGGGDLPSGEAGAAAATAGTPASDGEGQSGVVQTDSKGEA